MDQLEQLLASGKIKDGCTITAQGTVHIKNGEICIESLRSLVDIEGQNFEALCTGKERQPTESFIDLKRKLEEVSKQNETMAKDVTNAMNLVDSLKNQLVMEDRTAKETLTQLQSQLEEFSSARAAANELIGSLRQKEEESSLRCKNLEKGFY